MKKNVIIFLFIIILTIMIAIGTPIIRENLTKNNKDYKGELATNKQQQNLSIFVLPAIPIISIISPENITYSTSTILLDYSIKNADTIWYNLDNLENITITSSLYFSATEGSHVLYLYANNSQGTSVKSLTFSVKIEIVQPPSSRDGEGGNGGGGGGITENKTEQQKENITTPQETSPNIAEQEMPKNITENPEETPRTSKEIIIKFLINLFILILLVILVIVLIAIIKRKLKKEKQKKK